jgi:hypothetical protein
VGAEFSQTLKPVARESGAIPVSIRQSKEIRVTHPEFAVRNAVVPHKHRVAASRQIPDAQRNSRGLQCGSLTLPPVIRLTTMVSGGQVDENRVPARLYSFDDDITHENLPVVGMGHYNYVNVGVVRLLLNLP